MSSNGTPSASIGHVFDARIPETEMEDLCGFRHRSLSPLYNGDLELCPFVDLLSHQCAENNI